MSWWDLFIILMMAIALLRGYQCGFALRLGGWVGGVIAFFGVWYWLPAIQAQVYKYFDGEHMVAGWIQAYLAKNHSAGTPQSVTDLTTFIQNLPLTDGLKHTLVTQLATSSSDMYRGVLVQVADAIAVPTWKMLLFVICWLAALLALGLIGYFLNWLLWKVSILCMIDRFIGAIVSVVLSVIVLALVTSIVGVVFPAETAIGYGVDHSFLATGMKSGVKAFLFKGYL